MYSYVAKLWMFDGYNFRALPTWILFLGCLNVKNATYVYNYDNAGNVIKGEEIIEYVDFGADIHRYYQVEGEEEIYVKILAEGAELNISVERELK